MDIPHTHAGPPRTPVSAVDPAAESLTKALRSAFNVLRAIMIGLVVLYAFTGFFRLQPGEQGLVSRLGALRQFEGGPVLREGTHVVMPAPFDEKIAMSGQVQGMSINSFMFRPADPSKPLADWMPTSQTLKPGVDGAMFTGDRNLSHGQWQIEYKVARAEQFVTHVGDTIPSAGHLLWRVAEAAVVRSVSHRRVDEVLRGQISQIALEVKERMQKELDRLETGIEITSVRAVTREPPQVRVAYDAVTQAASEKSRLEEAARQKEAEILNQAAGPQHRGLLDLINQYGAAQIAGADAQRLAGMRAEIDQQLEQAGGNVARTLEEAKSRRQEIIEQVRREYEEFGSVLKLYRQDPRATLLRLWSDMRARVQDSKFNSDTFLMPGSNNIDIIINRNAERQQQADVERYRQRGTAPRGSPEVAS